MVDLESDTGMEGAEENESSAWLFTFADMMTLILTFFVLLYSMSKMEVEKFKMVMTSVQSSFGEYAPAIARLKITEAEDQQEKEAEDEGPLIDQAILDEMKSRGMLKEIQDFITKKGLDKHIIASVENANIVLRVKDAVLFPSGKAELTAKAKPVLNDIIAIFQKYMDFRVSIAGHTDDVPISTVQFPSNWELSAVRATTVLRYLIEGGVDMSRLTATGYGELMPLFPNDSVENRAQNRRVEFVLEKEKR
jgi:chemotaxis protein MotB